MALSPEEQGDKVERLPHGVDVAACLGGFDRGDGLRRDVRADLLAIRQGDPYRELSPLGWRSATEPPASWRP